MNGMACYETIAFISRNKALQANLNAGVAIRTVRQEDTVKSSLFYLLLFGVFSECEASSFDKNSPVMFSFISAIRIGLFPIRFFVFDYRALNPP